jgi:hypothetical protein
MRFNNELLIYYLTLNVLVFLHPRPLVFGIQLVKEIIPLISKNKTKPPIAIHTHNGAVIQIYLLLI